MPYTAANSLTLKTEGSGLVSEYDTVFSSDGTEGKRLYAVGSAIKKTDSHYFEALITEDSGPIGIGVAPGNVYGVDDLDPQSEGAVLYYNDGTYSGLESSLDGMFSVLDFQHPEGQAYVYDRLPHSGWTVQNARIVDNTDYDIYTTSLIHFDEDNEYVLDEVNRIWFKNGDVYIDYQDSKFGGASLNLSGTTDSFLFAPKTELFNLNEEEWTIESFVKLNSLPPPGQTSYVFSTYYKNKEGEIISDDPYWDKVVSLLRFDDNVGATNIVDLVEGNEWTLFGDLGTSNERSKWGNSLYAPYNTNNNASRVLKWENALGKARIDRQTPFTIEFWLYRNTVGGTGSCIILSDASSFDAYNLRFYVETTNIVLQVNGSLVVNTSISSNQWHHFAYSYDGITGRVYINGILSGSSNSNSRAPANPPRVLTIYGHDPLYSSSPSNGNVFIDEFRITCGVARYTSNFTVPSDPFPGFQIVPPEDPNEDESVIPGLKVGINENGNSVIHVSGDGLTTTVEEGNSSPIGDNNWHHLVWQKYQKKIWMYIDGEEVNSFDWDLPVHFFQDPNKKTIAQIGSSVDEPNSIFDGNIDEFRISNRARYGLEGDPYWDKTRSLIQFDKFAPSGLFFDEKQGSWSHYSNTVSSQVVQDKTTNRSGVGCGNFSGSNHLLVNSATDVHFGDNDFTIEMWVRPSSFVNERPLFYASGGATNQVVCSMTLSASTGILTFRYTTNGSSLTSVLGPSCTLNEWQHVAVSRNGSEIRIFKDGVQISPYFIGSTIFYVPSSRNRLSLGGNISSTSNNFSGSIDEFRLTIGVGRYIDNFTPTSERFPNFKVEEPPEVNDDPYYDNVTSLMHFENES